MGGLCVSMRGSLILWLWTMWEGDLASQAPWGRGDGSGFLWTGSQDPRALREQLEAESAVRCFGCLREVVGVTRVRGPKLGTSRMDENLSFRGLPAGTAVKQRRPSGQQGALRQEEASSWWPCPSRGHCAGGLQDSPHPPLTTRGPRAQPRMLAQGSTSLPAAEPVRAGKRAGRTDGSGWGAPHRVEWGARLAHPQETGSLLSGRPHLSPQIYVLYFLPFHSTLPP